MQLSSTIPLLELSTTSVVGMSRPWLYIIVFKMRPLLLRVMNVLSGALIAVIDMNLISAALVELPCVLRLKSLLFLGLLDAGKQIVNLDQATPRIVCIEALIEGLSCWL